MCNQLTQSGIEFLPWVMGKQKRLDAAAWLRSIPLDGCAPKGIADSRLESVMDYKAEGDETGW